MLALTSSGRSASIGSSSVSLKCGIISLPTELTESASEPDCLLLVKSIAVCVLNFTGGLTEEVMTSEAIGGEADFSSSSLLLFKAAAAAMAAAEALNLSSKALCSAKTSVVEVSAGGGVEAGCGGAAERPNGYALRAAAKK